jgi:hypothetical protein
MPLDTAVVWPNGKVYFFRGTFYSRFDIAAGRVDAGYPLKIEGNWPGLTFLNQLGGAVVWPRLAEDGRLKAYFCHTADIAEYVRYDILSDKQDNHYPKPIKGNWSGVPFGGGIGIDSVIAWPDGRIYIFGGDSYIRYNISDQVDIGYPKLISGNWPGLNFDRVDASIVWPKPQPISLAGFGEVGPFPHQKAYLFRGDEYVQYDIPRDRVDPGYPRPIAEDWHGLADLL